MAKPSVDRNAAMRVQDMTRGNSLRLMLRFAAPLFIGNIFQQLYGAADTMVVGYALGDAGIAAIGATSAVYLLLLNIAIGLNNGFAIVATKCFGARDEKGFRQAVAGMAMLNIAAVAALSALSLCFLTPLLRVMNTPEALFKQAYVYIAILLGGMACAMLYNMLSSVLRAVGNSVAPLWFLAISCVLNILLDVLLVVIIPLGVAGAALATVLSQAVSAGLCLAYMRRNYKAMLPKRADFRPPRAMIKELCLSGFAMALTLCVVDIGSVLYSGATNKLGGAIIAAHAASRRVLGIMIQPLSTLSMAAATFVGQNRGAGRFDRVKRGFWQVMGMEAAWAFFSLAVIYALGEPLIRLITGTADKAVLDNAVLSLRVHFACFPALGALFCLRTTMQSLGRKAAPVFSGVIELAVKAAAAFWFIPRYGFIAACCAEPAAWVLMAAFLAVAYAISPLARPASAGL